MIRLFKFAAYSLLGYVLYELVMGLSEGAADHSAATKQKSSPPGRKSSPQGGSGGMPRRKGQIVDVQDSSGMHKRQSVGRGVV